MHNSSRNAWQSSMGYPSAPNISVTLEFRLGFVVRDRVTRKAVLESVHTIMSGVDRGVKVPWR